MPDTSDIKLGTAAEGETNVSNAPDMSLYWYPPGKTEPELKPQPEPAPVPAEVTTTDATDEERPRRRKL